MFGNVLSLCNTEAASDNKAQDGINEEVPDPIMKHLDIYGFIAILHFFGGGGQGKHLSSYAKWIKGNVPFNLLKTNLSCR